MKYFITISFNMAFHIILTSQILSSFPGEKLKTEYICPTDNHGYNIGDYLTIGSASNNGKYNHIIIYGPQSTYYNIDNYNLKSSEFDLFNYEKKMKKEYDYRYKYANEDIKGYRSKITKLKYRNLRGKKQLFAILYFRGSIKIAIAIDQAIDSRELKSNSTYFNDNFVKIKSERTPKENNKVLTFDDKFSINLIRCYGNKSEQSVVLELSMRHNLVNQRVQVDYFDRQAFDYNGNDYKINSFLIGSQPDDNTIPTNISINCKIKINSVLPSVTMLSQVTSKIRFCDKGSFLFSPLKTLTFKDILIDWNYLDSLNTIKNEQERIKAASMYTSLIEAKPGIQKDNLKFKLLSIKGDKASQKVTIEWLVENTAINIDKFQTNVETIVDNLGNEILLNEAYYGATKVNLNGWSSTTKKLIRNVPIKIKYIYIGVPPESESIKYFELPFTYHNIGKPYNDIVKNKIMCNDLKITW